MMEIDQLISLVTKQVRERLETFENRKKVLMLGNFDSLCFENLCSMFESSGFALCDIESYKKEQDVDNYEFIVIPKSKFKELLQQVKSEGDAIKLKDIPCSEEQITTGNKTVISCKIDKKIVTEQDIQKLVREGCREIIISRKTIITPLALDSAKAGNIKIVRE